VFVRLILTFSKEEKKQIRENSSFIWQYSTVLYREYRRAKKLEWILVQACNNDNVTEDGGRETSTALFSSSLGQLARRSPLTPRRSHSLLPPSCRQSSPSPSARTRDQSACMGAKKSYPIDPGVPFAALHD
jgi:hypothetical protein